MKRIGERIIGDNLISRLMFLTAIFIVAITAIFTLWPSSILAETGTGEDNPAWTIYYRPGVRFGTDNRTLYINDFLIPLYQDEKNILFNNTRFTPNDQDGWEVNVGLGYRRLLLDDRLVLGINGFYDQRKTPWGTFHEQWGIGAEGMADVPIGNMDLGLTARFNYYHPITGADIYIGPNGGYVDRGNGVFSFDDAYVEEPLGGVDGEAGIRVPYVSDYVETWVYGGGYHFGGKYIKDIDGVSARLEVIPTDFLRVSYEYRSDRIQNDQHYGEVSVEIPFSIDNLIAGKNPFEDLGKRLRGSRKLRERLVEPVRRDVDVLVIHETGSDAAEILNRIYVIYANALDNIYNPNLEIIGDIIFVSENAEGLDEDEREGTIDRPFASIQEAIDRKKALFNSGQANTICVLNDNPTDGDYFDPDIATWAGGGTIGYAEMMILGSGIAYMDTVGLDELKSQLLLRFPSSLHPGFATIGEPLTIKASYVTVAGLKFISNGKFNNNVGIRIDGYMGSNLKPKALKGIVIRDNIVNINNVWQDIVGAYGIGCYNVNNPVGSVNNPLVVYNNDITVGSLQGEAIGIDIDTNSSETDIVVIDNTISVASGGINPLSYGIRLDCNRSLPARSDLFTAITNNTIAVTGETGSSYGIYVHCEGVMASLILNNTITVTGEGPWPTNDAYGIDIENTLPKLNPPKLPLGLGKTFVVRVLDYVTEYLLLESINAFIEPLQRTFGTYDPIRTVIAGNPKIYAHSDYGPAYGISLVSENSVYAYLIDNDNITVTSSGSDILGDTCGISIVSQDESINGVIDQNNITVSANSDSCDAYGIRLTAGKNWFTSLGLDVPETMKSNIGGSGSSLMISNNDIKVGSNSEAYGIYGSAGSGSISANIIDNNMSRGITGIGDTGGIVMRAPKGKVDIGSGLSSNTINVTSDEGNAAGLLLMGRALGGSYQNDLNSFNGSVSAPHGYADEVMRAIVVDKTTDLNSQIKNGTDNWIYLRGGDYVGNLDPIERGVNLWGEHYKMFGISHWATLNIPIVDDWSTLVDVPGIDDWPVLHKTLTLNAPNIRVMGLEVSTTSLTGRGIAILNGNGVELRDNYILMNAGQVTDAFGISFVGDNLGLQNAPLLINHNRIEVTGYSGNVVGVLLKADEGIFANITRNRITAAHTNTSTIDDLGSACGITLYGTTLNTNISDNKIDVSSVNSDAAGICLVSKNTISGYWDDNNDITVEAAEGIAERVINAHLVETTAELNDKISNGLRNWIYLKAGDYSGNVNTINRSLNLWGEHYRMFGLGSNQWPTLDSTVTVNASDIRIMGIEIDTTDSYGIKIENSDGLTLRDNEITVTNATGEAYGISFEGDTLGSEEEPALISGNTITVTGNRDYEGENGPDYCYVAGINVRSETDVFTRIINNDIVGNNTAGIAFGINIVSNGEIGSSDTFGTPESSLYISNNTISSSGFDWLSGNGIGLDAWDSIFADIEKNTITGSGRGISLVAGESNFYDTTMQSDILAEISDNKILIIDDVGIMGRWTPVGIYLRTLCNGDSGGKGVIGSPERPLHISGNTINVIALSSTSSAHGISVDSNEAVYADIENNTMPYISIFDEEQEEDITYPGIYSAHWGAGGIGLSAENYDYFNTISSVGTPSNPVTIHNNTMSVGSGQVPPTPYDWGYDGFYASGVSLSASKDVFAQVNDNTIDVTGTKSTAAYFANYYWHYSEAGVHPLTPGGLIDVSFSSNTGNIDGHKSYLVFFDPSYSNAEYYSFYTLTLSDNSVTHHPSANWSGNYGAGNEVYWVNYNPWMP